MAKKDSDLFEKQLDFIGENSVLNADDGSDTNRKFSNKDNDLAEEEDRNWNRERTNLDGKHGIKLEKALFDIAIILVYILSILLFILILIWFYHLVAPECFKWLNNKTVQSIERILFASTLLSLAGRYFSKYKILKKN